MRIRRCGHISMVTLEELGIVYFIYVFFLCKTIASHLKEDLKF